MIPYGHQTIEEDDVQAVVDALRSDWLTQGPRVEEFEKALAAKGDARFAVVFANGTLALQAAYAAAGLGPGDEFICSPLTFAATANAALWFGSKPVFVDVDPASGNLDAAKAEAAITPRTKALVAVDFAGHPVDWDRLIDIARRHRLVSIDDACHALGARYKNRAIGGIADLTVFSFHPVKSITTGEGGAVLTNDPALHQRMVRFRHHGITKQDLALPSPGDWYHEMQSLGTNGRLTDFQCALGASQLKKLDRFILRRRAIAAYYVNALRPFPGLRPLLPSEGTESAWHLFVVLLEGEWAGRRDWMFKTLKDKGIGTQVHYIPVYRHPHYEKLGYRPGLCPAAEEIGRRCLSLPIYPLLSDADAAQVVKTIGEVLKETAIA